jgi:polyisoprenoid-binding protein YceI
MELRMISGFKSTRATSLGLAAAAALFAAALSLSAQMPGGPGGPGGGQQPAPPPTAGATLTIIDGSSASYKVTEQFVGIDFPNDAVGTTTAVSGTIVIGKDSAIEPGSKLTVDLAKLSSDQDMRDNFARTRVLDTATYPNAVFVPTKVTGIPAMIPFQNQSGVSLTGNLTIHGVTKEVTFKGIVTFNRDGTLAGIAKTNFTWATFSLTPPKIGRLANVSDNVELTIVFKFKRS